MKAPNSLGSVELVCSKSDRNKRRKPYRVRIVTGWEVDVDNLKLKAKRKTIGYARTRKEGNEIRDKYHNQFYNVDIQNVSFNFLFGLFYEYKKKKIKSYKKNIFYSNFYNDIEKKAFIDITAYDLQRIIDEKMIDLSSEYQKKVIGLYHEMWEFAKNNNINVNADASKLVIKKTTKPKNPHKPIKDEDITVLWNNRNEIVDIVLCMIYTGVRPGEMLIISKVDEDYFISGSKTEAGRNRVIPLHNDIKDIFHSVYNSGILNKFSSEDSLYQAIKKCFKKLNMNEYTPYDCRHTFATLADRYELKDYPTKLILGHHIEDLTKRVYTHKKIDELIREVNKIKIDI